MLTAELVAPSVVLNHAKRSNDRELAAYRHDQILHRAALRAPDHVEEEIMNSNVTDFARRESTRQSRENTRDLARRGRGY
jgi:hypothetical protein